MSFPNSGERIFDDAFCLIAVEPTSAARRCCRTREILIGTRFVHSLRRTCRSFNESLFVGRGCQLISD